MTVFIDSDVLMEILLGRDQAVLSTWRSLVDAEAVLLVSPVSVGEIWASARAHEHVLLMQLFRSLLCVSIDCETGKQAGEYLRKFSRNYDFKIADALIAASAIRHHAALWTRDRNRYPMHELSFYV